ncbi:hypothetical protein [Saccharomonospora marina]|nr:hypothetical protein [Saccharomonospora marina]
MWTGRYSIKVTTDLYGKLVPEEDDARPMTRRARQPRHTRKIVPLRPA